MKKFLFISNNTLTNTGLSGGDRILSELIKYVSQKYQCALLGSGECISQLNRYKALDNVVCYESSKLKKTILKYNFINYFIHTINRSFFGIISIVKYWREIKTYKYIYSASDFYPDTIPAFIIKVFYPKIIWISGFYLFAPKPFQKNNPYKTSVSRYIIGLNYWFTQLFTFLIVKKFSDFVCVTSKPDVKYFLTKHRKENKIVVVRGGVDLNKPHSYLKNNSPSLENKKFRAVFLGRLHYQKGLLKLIDIWKIVCDKDPKSKLAIIGDGQLLREIQNKIKKYHLSKNITLLGFLDGEEKYNIFKQSAIVVHPATYDSGGMATAEAMAWGLPGISFDLESLKTYYPQGVIKTKCFDLKEFADNIIKLTTDKKIYSRYSKEAIKLINTHWSWDSRCQDIINQIVNNSP